MKHERVSLNYQNFNKDPNIVKITKILMSCTVANEISQSYSTKRGFRCRRYFVMNFHILPPSYVDASKCDEECLPIFIEYDETEILDDSI